MSYSPVIRVSNFDYNTTYIESRINEDEGELVCPSIQ